MRPIHLSMTAFGPFPEQEEIDFKAFGESPLFLINGQTGSGKTTILDAICFALYGKSTGNERDGSQMRCDWAKADVLTEITFQFELGGRLFRIHRVPEQERPKSRGEGTTRQSSQAQLFELFPGGGENLIVSEKITEANRAIEELTGLSVDQFRQVMVLPQGKFRELLMADTSEREKIFGQLFQTQIYKKLEESLKEQAAGLRRKREQLLDKTSGILEGAEVSEEAELIQEMEELTPQLADAEKRSTKNNQYTKADKAFEQAKALEQTFRELERSIHLQEKLESQKDIIEQDRKRLIDNVQAQRIKPHFEALSTRETEFNQADTALAAATADQIVANADLEKAEQALENIDELKGERDNEKTHRAKLEGYRARAEQLIQATNELTSAEEKLKLSSTAFEKALVGLTTTTAKIKGEGEKQEKLEAEVTNLGQKKLKLQETKSQLVERNELEELINLQNQLQDKLQKHDEKILSLQRNHDAEDINTKQVELAWHNGQAAILSAQLEDDSPCPVCGSKSHPQPAKTDITPPTQEDLEQARNKLQETGRLLVEEKEQRAKVDTSLSENAKQQKTKRKNLKGLGDIPLQEVQAAHGGLVIEVSSLEKTAENIEIIKGEIKEFKKAEELAQNVLASAQEKMNEDKDKHTTAVATKSAAEKELPEELREAGALEQKIQEVTKLIGSIDHQIEEITNQYKEANTKAAQAETKLQSANNNRKEAEERRDTARQTWSKALASSAFDSEKTYSESLLADELQEEIAGQVKGYDEECNQAKGTVKTLKAQLKEKSRPDLENLEQQRQEAELAKKAAEEQWRQMDERLRRLKNTQEKLERAKQELADLDEEYKVIGTLSDVANGNNDSRISLQRFVLSVLLDDVLMAASQRLLSMSKGRYQLLRKEDPTRRNRAAGLDLEVEDAYTGTIRAVGTLSGGEGFMAALSLALGLSDVVQSYAGGVRLDTLFVDEGFGSLDPESLDLAIKTLIDLQSTGRMVGIISHVAELKEQMTQRIDVNATKRGSTITLVAV